MESFNGSGGLLILGFVAVWVIVFMPSIGKRKQSSSDQVIARQERLTAIREHANPELAKATARNKLNSRIALIAAALASAFTIYGVVQGSTVFVFSGLGVAAFALIISRIFVMRSTRKISQAANRNAKLPVGLTGKPVRDFDEIGETPGLRVNPVPSQLYTQRATIEEVAFAEVIKLEVPQELERETLDEILRRRRAN